MKTTIIAILVLAGSLPSFAYNTDRISEDELRLDCVSASNPIFGNRLTYVLGIDWYRQNAVNGLKMQSRPIVFDADDANTYTGLSSQHGNLSVDLILPPGIIDMEVGEKIMIESRFPKLLSKKLKTVMMSCKLVQFDISALLTALEE